MKFSVGDPVVFKSTKKEGKIKELLEDGMYLVESEGVLFPSYKEDLEHPYLQWFLSDKLKNIQSKQGDAVNISQQITANIENLKQFEHLKEGLYISYHPQYVMDDFFEETLSSLHIFLLNKTDQTFRVRVLETHSFEDENEEDIEEQKLKVFDHSNAMLFDCSMVFFNRNSAFKVLLEWKNEGRVFKKDLAIKFPKKQFFSYLPKQKKEPELHFVQAIEFDQFDIESFFINQEDTFTAKIKTEIKEEKEKVENIKKNAKVKLEEFYHADDKIDLHLDKIPTWDPSNHEFTALSFQLQYCEDRLEEAAKKGLKEIYVIHGVGQGVLKKQVHLLLDRLTSIVDDYEHGYFEGHGHGATKVYFKPEL